MMKKQYSRVILRSGDPTNTLIQTRVIRVAGIGRQRRHVERSDVQVSTRCDRAIEHDQLVVDTEVL